jgi:hypothetical protein
MTYKGNGWLKCIHAKTGAIKWLSEHVLGGSNVRISPHWLNVLQVIDTTDVYYLHLEVWQVYGKPSLDLQPHNYAIVCTPFYALK